MYSQEELQHHGILGMRWGVRRSKAQLARANGKPKSDDDEDYDVHEDYKKAHGSKSMKTMSDKELRERINRIQMEQQYRTLTEKKTLLDKGKKAVGEVLANAAKETAKTYVKKYMDNSVEALIKKASKNK